MKSKVCLVVGAILVFAVPSCLATAINPYNTRQVALGPNPASEQSLQSMLDVIYGQGNVIATQDQQTAGMWGVPGGGSGATIPILQFEQSGNAGKNTFGVWSGTDSTSLTFAPLFFGGAAPHAKVVLSWDADPNTVTIVGLGAGTNSAVVAGINRSSFGFYLECGTDCIGGGTSAGTLGKFWSVDQLNQNGEAQMLAYHGITPGQLDTWAFAFEDLAMGVNADGDHNDFVVTAESLAPVPEPGAIVLLGTALLGCVTVVKRRARKA